MARFKINTPMFSTTVYVSTPVAESLLEWMRNLNSEKFSFYDDNSNESTKGPSSVILDGIEFEVME